MQVPLPHHCRTQTPPPVSNACTRTYPQFTNTIQCDVSTLTNTIQCDLFTSTVHQYSSHTKKSDNLTKKSSQESPHEQKVSPKKVLPESKSPYKQIWVAGAVMAAGDRRARLEVSCGGCGRGRPVGNGWKRPGRWGAGGEGADARLAGWAVKDAQARVWCVAWVTF